MPTRRSSGVYFSPQQEHCEVLDHILGKLEG